MKGDSKLGFLFPMYHFIGAPLAQLAVREICNFEVGSSILSRGTTLP